MPLTRHTQTKYVDCCVRRRPTPGKLNSVEPSARTFSVCAVAVPYDGTITGGKYAPHAMRIPGSRHKKTPETVALRASGAGKMRDQI